MKTALILLALTLCWAGRSQAGPPSTNTTATSPPQATPAKSAAQPPAGMKVCFACKGQGEAVCNVLGCKDGWVDCPNHCIRLSEGKWEHQHVENYNDDDLWRIFTNDDGSRLAVNQSKAGDVMELQDGKWVDIGKCKVCGGTAKVKCSTCLGTGHLMCSICDGKKFVPESWTAFNNPKLKNPPKRVRLKDGTTVFVKIEGQVGKTILVRTEDGKQFSIAASDIVSQ